LVSVFAATTHVCAQPQSRNIYQEAVEALYNLDFSIAERHFDSLIHQDESNPDYWNGRASTILLRILYEQQKFNTESFTGNTIGAKGSKDTVNPLQEKKLRNTVDTAMQKANDLLAKNPDDVHALYALGVANATLASFEGLARHSYVSAHAKARLARNYHQQVLKIDPSFTDARLSVGVYEYGVGVIPRHWRLLLGMFGISGNKQEGIEYLEMVASKGTRAATDAKLLLVVVYEREARFDEALRLTDELHEKYPRNFQFEMSKATIYRKMKKFDLADQAYAHVIESIEAKHNGYDRMREDRVYYEKAKNAVDGLKFEEAISAFNRVVRGSKSTADEKADSLVWLGRIFDSRNERNKAVEQYNAVLKLNCDDEYKYAAQAYLKKPFKS